MVLHTPQSCFGPAWRSLLQIAISTIGNSTWLISAGYMIVNELPLTLGRCGVNPHSRWPCGPDPSSSRSPTRARGSSSRRDSRYVEYGVGHSLRKAYCRCQEGINRDTPGLDAHHKILSDGLIIAVPAGQGKNSWLLDPQTSAACPRMSPHV